MADFILVHQPGLSNSELEYVTDAQVTPYQGAGGTYPVVEELAQRGLCLPSYPNLRDDEVGYICNTLRELCAP